MRIRRRRRILTEEKLHEVVSFLDRRARKTLAHLAAPSVLSLGSVHTATRLLKLLPRKVTLVLD
jgi:hypothetical protein